MVTPYHHLVERGLGQHKKHTQLKTPLPYCIQVAMALARIVATRSRRGPRRQKAPAALSRSERIRHAATCNSSRRGRPAGARTAG